MISWPSTKDASSFGVATFAREMPGAGAVSSVDVDDGSDVTGSTVPSVTPDAVAVLATTPFARSSAVTV
ncbi:hypothetical protein ACFQBY_10220 [Promicromonospora citrea]|uniref:hypothetical protein n=1 Tax=Promicromonospora citrea TaxID=43677 RepID=UPI00166C2C15|nr:hypothetical protein [Promicromonospora citrea]